jgi:SAM-dependent methyltransferase
MTADYDAYADQYRRAKAAPFRKFVELPGHMAAMGELSGKDVVDLACGEGFLTREIKKAGAAHVVGVDVSAEMVALAREEELREPLGIEYGVSAAEAMGDIGLFDAASAGYLLCNARDETQLEGMLDSIAALLRPGGQFTTTDSVLWMRPEADLRPYGISRRVPSPVVDGQEYEITFHLDAGDSVTITNFAHFPEAIDRALAKAGFQDVRRHPPIVTPAGIEAMGEAYWRTYLDVGPITVITATRR